MSKKPEPKTKSKKSADILKSKPKIREAKNPRTVTKCNAPPDENAPFGYTAKGLIRKRPKKSSQNFTKTNGARVRVYDKNKHLDAFFRALSTGISLVSASAEVGVKYETAQTWLTRYPEFAEAVELGREAGRCTLEKTLIGQAQGSIVGSATSLIFYLKNRYPQEYRDRREVEVSGDSSMSINFDYEAVSDRED